MTQFRTLTRSTRRFVISHAPEIFSSLGIIGIYATTVLAVKSTPKALRIIEEKRQQEQRELTKREIVTACWKEYIPAAVTSLIATGCIIKSGRIHSQRELAMLSLYSLTETALREYQHKVREHFGDGKEQKVRDAIAQDRILHHPGNSPDVIISGQGNILCYDVPSDRYFRSDIEKIRRKENEFNRTLRSEMQLSLNDLYYELGLEGTKLGDHCGWNAENHILTFHFSSQLTTNGQPCLVIDYDIYPLYQRR